MPIVEQTIIIEASISTIMSALNDVQNIPGWATVTGVLDNVQGSGQGMTYNWRFRANHLSFSGQSQVIEQTERTLMTRTTGDIASLWTINLTPLGKNSTAMQVVVEYTPPHPFVEVMTDIVLEQLTHPEVAHENMRRFKEMVEKQVGLVEEQIIANY